MVLQIEEIKERAQRLYQQHSEMPSPLDEPTPRLRQQLEQERQRVHNEANAFHFAHSHWISIERQLQPLIAYRDGLIAGREKLQADLVIARAAYKEASKGGERNAKQERRKVDQIINTLGQIENGFGEYGLQPMLQSVVESVTHNFVWLHYSLPYTERLISNLREEWLATLSRLGDAEAQRVLTLRTELWKIEQDIANEAANARRAAIRKEPNQRQQVIDALVADRKLIIDELIRLGEFESDDSASDDADDATDTEAA